ncbi:Glutamine-dependent NAD(+) synthetase [Nitrosomonas nitrosa]|uniref:Glutamine-dependent NAD(+) synthetase n=1 Tax=Nitrosomonas nitrosa TaxID=52442 RepID=A0A8H8Z181_9PROT|nr:NAD(+) synthase [Nitrosomonas nitrosa]CAE6509494.1 Glutamine-dependent NAD(+) synthetase [Nitrosomonas nitrosa]
MQSDKAFFNLYHHGFVRVAVGIPDVRVADVAFNAAETIMLMEQAAEQHALVALFPELGLTAYSCEDLFHQQTLLAGAIDALDRILAASKQLPLVAVVGLPLQVNHALYNCAAILYRGRILGVVPKTFLPNYREFYELRQFAPASAANCGTITLCGQRAIPFGEKLLFRAENQPHFSFFAEICEDLWVPVPPSCHAALAGATLLLNLSASNITIGKHAYRHSLVANQSARCLAAYLYTAAGTGESTTDLAWDGHAMVYENGALLAESSRFQEGSQVILADIDLDRLIQERMRQNSFTQSARYYRQTIEPFREILFEIDFPESSQLLCQRHYDRFPYVPADPAARDAHCFEAYHIQVQGLVKRLKHTGIQKIVIGVSGGLDSTHALIVAARAMDVLRYPRTHILAYTMPGFATSSLTLNNARALMQAIGCTAHELDIRPSCEQMLCDLDHPYIHGEPVYDVTFENVQAGERTNHLFRLANRHHALVLGTGDLSELALGWCTYGVGDHMSHYAINASVPKTLIQFLIRWIADTDQLGEHASTVLRAILDTEISPELIPGKTGSNQPAQRTEAIIGPYELQDFNLYYTIRFGYLPTKIAFLAYCSWRDRSQGRWPSIPENQRNQYTIGEIKHWLNVFAYRFFQISQFKRSCIPNAPKVGSGGSLSPRGDYRAPSDSEAKLWLENVERIPDRAPDE